MSFSIDKSCRRSLDRSNTTMNHALSANCLRKCAYWQLCIQTRVLDKGTDKLTKQQLLVQKNSGFALRQMNYEVHQNLTREEIEQRKANQKMPARYYTFDHDIIDLMIEQENRSIYNMHKPDYHDPSCKAVKANAPNSAVCCEPLIKNFNQYNQRVYKDQQIELPFEVGSPSTNNSSKNADGLDLMSQMSSQFSDSSRGNISNYQKQMSTDALPPRDLMLQFCNKHQAENMVCLEFDLKDELLQANESQTDEE